MALLRDVPLFRDSACDDGQLSAIADQVKQRTYPGGHRLIAQGEMGSVFYLLEAGEVKILEDGKEVAQLSRGAHFGEQARAAIENARWPSLKAFRRAPCPGAWNVWSSFGCAATSSGAERVQRWGVKLAETARTLHYGRSL